VIRLLLVFLVLACSCGAATAAESLTARAAVAANVVFVGEPFRFQIQVSGSESPERPELSGLRDFKSSFTGGGTNSRTSMTVINGRMTHNVQKGFILNYEFKATREGRFTIPPITVKADGKTTTTQALGIVVQRPSETENYKLRLSLSKEQAYVGEQLVLETTFFFSANLNQPQLSFPFTDKGAFEIYDLGSDQPRAQETLDGKRFNTLRVRKVLVPRRAGRFTLDPATLTFEGQEGTEIGKDFFGRQVRRPKFKRFVIPSNSLELTVKALPQAGRPANFAGHVGEYSVSVQAAPTEVNVGDPITLNISVAGPAMLEPVKAPALQNQESLANDFKVPSEIADGSVNGSFKVFTQTIRPLREDVAAIPPIELPYFDTAKGAYGVARSAAIPLVVRATRILTADDAEGLVPLAGAGAEVQSWMQGIAHNYSGAEVLASRLLGFSGLLTPPRAAVIAGPPLVYLILLGLVAAKRRRDSDPDARRAKKAHGEFQRGVAQAGTVEEVLAALRAYLGDRLTLTSGALTYRDVEPPLQSSGVGESQLAELEQLFNAGEASRYAGGIAAEDLGGFRDQVATVVKEIEGVLR